MFIWVRISGGRTSADTRWSWCCWPRPQPVSPCADRSPLLYSSFRCAPWTATAARTRNSCEKNGNTAVFPAAAIGDNAEGDNAAEINNLILNWDFGCLDRIIKSLIPSYLRPGFRRPFSTNASPRQLTAAYLGFLQDKHFSAGNHLIH